MNKSNRRLFPILNRVKVDRRYSEFAALHASLKSHSRDLNVKLPPKKLRPSSEFLSKRLSELDEYIKDIVEYYGETLPIKLTDFLHFFKFEPHGLVHQLYQCIKEVITLLFASQVAFTQFITAETEMFFYQNFSEANTSV